MTSHKIDDVTQQYVRARTRPAARIIRNYGTELFECILCFGDIIKRHTFEFTSLKVENGVVEVDDDDDIAIDSKDTAALRFVPTTVTGLL